MRALPGTLPGTIVFEPEPHHDQEGFETSTFDAELAAAVGLDVRTMVRDHQVRIRRGAVRGLSLRTDGGEGTLVRCAAGSVIDVAVDLRPGSATYRSWMTVVLDDRHHRSVWLPAGLAHGFQALSEQADVCLRVNRVRQPGRETAIRFDDPELAIPWPLPVSGVRDGDRQAPALAVVEPMLSEWFGVLR